MDDKEQWLHKKLGDSRVSTIIMGQSPSSSAYNEEGVGIPFLQGCAEFGEVFPNTTVFSADLLKIAPENSILMSVRAPVGTINKADQKYVIGRGLCSIVPVIDGDFLYYYLLQNTHELELKAQGSTFLAINSSELNEMPISYPASLPAQRRIAAILSSADKVIASTQKVIAKYKQMKQGMMENLLKPKEGWKMVRLGEVGEIITGLTYSPNNVCQEGVLVLRSSNIQDDNLCFEDNVYVDVENYNPVIENDILICVRNGSRALIGKTARITKEVEGCAFGAFMLVYRSSYNDFLYYFFKSDMFFSQVSRNIGATINSINGSDLKNMEVYMPSDFAKQRRIASILSGIDSKIAAEEKVLEKYEKVKKGMMEKMLQKQ